MELYSENKSYKLYHGNMLDMLDVIDLNSIDSIVTDPPYELNFMGKGWDNAGVSFQKETWKKCFDVLKPGGYLLAFGGSRTYHRIACAIEDAGFEIRDTIMWLYGSGFPKGINIANGVEGKLTIGSANKKDQKQLDGEKGIIQLGYNKNNAEDGWRPNNYNGQETTVKVNYTTEEAKRWQGWNTALKPSYEPIIVARKPFDGTLIDNVLKYGVGGINIDECRVPLSDNEPDNRVGTESVMHTDGEKMWYGENGYAGKDVKVYKDNGRYPANTILTYDDTDYEEVCGGFPITKSVGGSMTMPDLRDVGKKSKESIGIDKLSFGQVSNAERKETSYTAPSDEGSAARYFYNAQKSNRDRELGTYGYCFDQGKRDSKPMAPGYDDSGSASRYFYCAKASKRDRDEGLDAFADSYIGFSNQAKAELRRGNIDFSGNEDNPLHHINSIKTRKNTHPTVKPCALMQYLVRLVTPKGGTILDPFNGSGSTGKATMYENKDRNANYKYIGIELTDDYLPIARARIEYAMNDSVFEDLSYNNIKETPKPKTDVETVKLW